MDQLNLNMRQHWWLDIVKDYDWEILYHPDKENAVADALSRKSAGSSDGVLCMRISSDSLLLALIREAHAEGVQEENFKKERIRGEIVRFASDSRGC